MSDLRGILGDRYGDVIEEAAGFLHALDWDGDEREAELMWANYSDMSVVRQECLRTAEAVLGAVLPDLLAAERERADAAEAKAARYARYVRHYAEEERKLCGWCHKTPVGVAEIGGRRYCHDGASPTCYESASRRHIILAEMIDIAFEAGLYEATSGSARGIR